MTREKWRSVMFKAINFVDSECGFLSPDHKDLARSLLRCIYRALE